jgi:beta-apo-4'-carotenal oxygenase
MASIPEFVATPLEDIPGIAKRVRDKFRTHQTKDIEWRLVQLRKLYWALTDLAPMMQEALKRDLHKADVEAALQEVLWLRNDCMFMIDNVKNFAKDEKFGSPYVPMTFAMMKFYTRKDPLGAVLIIGPYNLPLQLLIAPLIGAIAAGCTAVLKPSEVSPASAMVSTEIVKRLDPDAYQIVNGAVPETTALLNEKWDKILYTGSASVGKIIAKKAAETLTPVCLELGGKNPAFVTKQANLPLTARRLLWGKSSNAGQVCVSHNYVLVERDVAPVLIAHLNTAFKEAFPKGAQESPDLARMVNVRHFQRVKAMLDNTKGKIVMGGQMDESDLFIAPTAVLVDSIDDAMMKEESFGPIFAIYPVDSLDEALKVADQIDRTPLAVAAFGSKVENQRSRSSFLTTCYDYLC